MTASLPPMIRFQPFAAGSDGVIAPLPGGKVYFYQAGTTTPQNVYAADGTTSIGNNLTLDANGATDFRLGTALSYKINITDSVGGAITGWPVDSVTNDDYLVRMDLASTGTGKGTKMVAHKATGTGSVATTQDEVNSRVIHVSDFLTDAQKADWLAGTGALDTVAAINAAITYAASISYGITVTPYDNIYNQGAVVKLLPGKTNTNSGSIVLKAGVILEGAGKYSTVITSTYDGQIVYNSNPGYDMFGCGLKKLMIKGDITKTNQTGLDILRDWWGEYSDISVMECGGTGIRLRQCIDTQLTRVQSILNIGHGLWVSEGITESFPTATYTSNNLPSLGVIVDNVHVALNGQSGIYHSGQTSGCNYRGGGSESNSVVRAGSLISGHSYTIQLPGTTSFTSIGAANNNNGTSFTATGVGSGTGYASENNTGYNVEITGSSYIPNEFTDFWVEGICKAHVRTNMDTTNPVRFTRLHHIANATGTIDRAFINDKGFVYIDQSFGQYEAYKNIGGSIAPFQINIGGGSAGFRIKDPVGSTIPRYGAWVENESNVTTGLDQSVRLRELGYYLGEQRFTNSNGQLGTTFRVEGDTYDRCQVDTYYKRINWGSGSAAPRGVLPVEAGANVSSGTTITPTGGVFHVTGTSAIATINLPYTGFVGSIVLIPDAAFTTTTAGNIYLASTAVANKALIMTFDGTKWYPSY